MRKKEEKIQIEGFNLLLDAMKDQNKGSVVLSQNTGVSILTIYKIVRGGNFLAETMNKICKELGLKLVIEKDDHRGTYSEKENQSTKKINSFTKN